MISCETIQERLAENAAAALAGDTALRRHVDGCAACGQVLNNLELMDRYLSALPEYDPPADVRNAVLEAARRPLPPRATSSTHWATGLASAAVIVAAIGLTYSVVDRFEPHREPALTEATVDATEPYSAAPPEDAETARSVEAIAGLDGQSTLSPAENEAVGTAAIGRTTIDKKNLSRATPDQRSDADRTVNRKSASSAARQEMRPASSREREHDSSPVGAGHERLASLSAALPLGQPVDGPGIAGRDLAASAPPTSAQHAKVDASAPRSSAARREAGPRHAEENDAASSGSSRRSVDEVADRLYKMQPEVFLADNTPRQAQDYLEALERTDGLRFQDPSGYWANTYVPGDPAIRVLENRLAALQGTGVEAVLPVTRVDPLLQPFDTPADSALALYVQGDKTAAEGRTRLRLQIGLQGIDRPRATRPAARAVLLLDLAGGVDDQTLRRYRALIDALRDASIPGDTFALVIAGPSGGLVLAPGDFRHGPIELLHDRLTRAPAAGAATVTLGDAVALSLDHLHRTGLELGAENGGQLLIATDRSHLDSIDALEALVFQGALTGVVTSVVSTQGALELDQLDRLVLAGQGRRWVLSGPDRAAAVVERELNAFAEIVARALRLQIRLAPHVQLLNVVGSERIDARAVERTRRIERHIDQRIAADLGIESDRGADQEGIQILIPSFYAGDSHVILLDVVAEHPGPIAEVSVRYKDLVFLRNGVARGQFNLARGTDAPGPLERSVLKNLIAQEMSRAAWTASQQLTTRELDGALRTLASVRELVDGLRGLVPGWDTDPELERALALVREHITLINRHRQAPAMLPVFADSLHYASIRMLLDPAP